MAETTAMTDQHWPSQTTTLDIIGPGAIGLHVALALPESLAVQLRHPAFSYQSGVWIADSDSGQGRQATLLPLNDPAPLHLAIVTTKSFQVVPVLTELRHRWAPEAEVLLLTNGLGFQDEARAFLPGDANLWVGVTTEGSLRTEPFRRRHTGHGETALGPWQGHHRPGTLARWLSASSLDTVWHSDSADVRARVWQKLIMNCAINPLSALHNVPNGALNEPDLTPVWQAVVAEAVQVARAEGLALTAAAMQDQVANVITATARNFSSMHQDVLHQRPTEANDILGVLVRLAERHRLAVPALHRLWRRVQAFD